MIPTLLGILIINFFVIQAAPGGPIEQVITTLQNGPQQGQGTRLQDSSGTVNLFDQGTTFENNVLPEEVLEELKVRFGFDKPLYERFYIMVKNYLSFNFGVSYFQNRPVMDIVLEKLPVSLSLSLWSLLFIYLIAISLGVSKAVKHGSSFDQWSSGFIIVSYAIPSFLFGIFLIVLFAGGYYWNLFPLRGLVSENFQSLTTLGKIKDYFWHLTLPLTAIVISGFAKLCLLIKNACLEEMTKPYVITALAKGLTRQQVLIRHVLPNTLILLVAGFPGLFCTLLFSSTLLVEILFSLDGLGLLGFEATTTRDYPVMFATLYIFTFLSLILHLIGDLIYGWMDPRIRHVLNERASS